MVIVIFSVSMAVTVPPTTNRIVLVTGDDDLVPAVETLTAQGRHVVLVTDPGNAATHLINAASSVVDLNALMPDQ